MSREEHTMGTNRKINSVRNSSKYLTLLSEITLRENESTVPLASPEGQLNDDAVQQLSRVAACLRQEELTELGVLANSHHVIMRSFPRLRQMMSLGGNSRWAEWADDCIDKERQRIHHALSFLNAVCGALEEAGSVIVIKSLDHWPDLGSDLDLFTDAEASDVVAIMRRDFQAGLAKRSWGDRLANKWNFTVPGLPELVEVHVGRLGQTGEQITTARSLVTRSRPAQIEAFEFRIPAPEERLLISTLQRMYRHFYIRLCDILDNARLIESNGVDYVYLRSLAQTAGLWVGLATYLVIISDYVESYRGYGLDLPATVSSAADFGGREVSFRRRFLRIPLVPHAARLYASELARLLMNGELGNTLRLSLLPGLATAAALELKLTGSDKGIW
jgi:hypothetical protein